MKKLLFHISMIAWSFTAAAQSDAGAAAQSDAGKLWTMEECMAYAADHSTAVEKARWDLATADVNSSEALAEFFPSLSAQVGSQFNWGRNIDPETNTYNNVTTFNNGYGVYASLTLFDGGRTFHNYKLARAERKRSVNSVQMQRDDRAIATMMAYVDAIYYSGAVDIASDRLAQSRELLKLTALQEELGLKGHPDVAQAQATVAGDEYDLVRQRNLLTQAMLTLRSTMNYPSGEELLLAPMETAADMPAPATENADEVYSLALATNPTAIEARLNVTSRSYLYKVAKGSMFPTISVNAGISTSYFKTLTGGYSAPRFGEQFRNNRGEYASVSLNIPLFSNLNIMSGVKRAKYALSRALTEKEEQLRKLHDDIALAVADRDGYAMEMLSLKAKTEADRKTYELNSRKYEEGLLSLTDRQISANTYYSSELSLLQTQMLYILKNKLVDYYKGNQSWMSR